MVKGDQNSHTPCILDPCMSMSLSTIPHLIVKKSTIVFYSSSLFYSALISKGTIQQYNLFQFYTILSFYCIAASP